MSKQLFHWNEFSNARHYLAIGIVLTVVFSCGDEEATVHPAVGKWRRDFYQFKNLPVTHKHYENLILPSIYVPGTTGIYSESRYDLTLSKDNTFSRILAYPNFTSSSDNGTWKIQGNQLVINSQKYTQDERYTLHSNSGTRMALYQEQTWLLLPNIVIDTLSEDYFQAHAEELFDQYANEVELNMYYFFERIE